MRELEAKKEFEERVIQVDRVTRVVAGGRRMRFRAAVVIGNRRGKVGIGVGKSGDVIGAVQKAIVKAKKNLIEVKMNQGTIPYEVTAKYGGATVFMKPAFAGTGIIAGGAVRSVAELAGISDILSKILGSNNKINNLKATMIALSSFDLPHAKTESGKIETKVAENKPTPKTGIKGK